MIKNYKLITIDKKTVINKGGLVVHDCKNRRRVTIELDRKVKEDINELSKQEGIRYSFFLEDLLILGYDTYKVRYKTTKLRGEF